MDDERQSPEELDAHFGPEGPVAAVRSWLSTVLEDGDLETAWPSTDPTLRRVCVQAWIWANRGHAAVASYPREELAEALAAEKPSHPLWKSFADTQVNEFQQEWAGVDLETWGAGSRPRPVGPDLEVVMLVDPASLAGAREQFIPGTGYVPEVLGPTLVNAVRAIVRSTPEGWLIAGFGDSLYSPGWPPEPSGLI